MVQRSMSLGCNYDCGMVEAVGAEPVFQFVKSALPCDSVGPLYRAGFGEMSKEVRRVNGEAHN